MNYLIIFVKINHMKNLITLLFVLLSVTTFSQNLNLIVCDYYSNDTLIKPNEITLDELKKLSFLPSPCKNSEFTIDSNKILVNVVCELGDASFNYDLKIIKSDNQFVCFNKLNDYMVTYKLFNDNDTFYFVEYQPFDSPKSFTIWKCKKKG